MSDKKIGIQKTKIERAEKHQRARNEINKMLAKTVDATNGKLEAANKQIEVGTRKLESLSEKYNTLRKKMQSLEARLDKINDICEDSRHMAWTARDRCEGIEEKLCKHEDILTMEQLKLQQKVDKEYFVETIKTFTCDHHSLKQKEKCKCCEYFKEYPYNGNACDEDVLFNDD